MLALQCPVVSTSIDCQNSYKSSVWCMNVCLPCTFLKRNGPKAFERLSCKEKCIDRVAKMMPTFSNWVRLTLTFWDCSSVRKSSHDRPSPFARAHVWRGPLQTQCPSYWGQFHFGRGNRSNGVWQRVGHLISESLSCIIPNSGLLQLGMTNLDLLTLLMSEEVPSKHNVNPIAGQFHFGGGHRSNGMTRRWSTDFWVFVMHDEQCRPSPTGYDQSSRTVWDCSCVKSSPPNRISIPLWSVTIW